MEEIAHFEFSCGGQKHSTPDPPTDFDSLFKFQISRIRVLVNTDSSNLLPFYEAERTDTEPENAA